MNATKYLDRAITCLRSIGLPIPADDKTPLLPLLEKIQHYDSGRVMSIAAILQHASTFNSVVREHIAGMDIGTRYTDIAESFNTIRDDAASMATWMNDGKISGVNRMRLGWMNLRRGSLPNRFNAIRTTYQSVAGSTLEQIQREEAILAGYQDFRMALKAAEVDAQDLLALANAALERRKLAMSAAVALISAEGEPSAARSKLELSRDEALRALQAEDKCYQIAKDLADDLKTAYSTAEVVFARIQQTHSVKERLYRRAVTFFDTNEVVFTGLAVAYTSSAGMTETTNAMNAMTDGISRGLEDLAKVGNRQLEAGMRAGYGSTIRASSVRTLVDAVVEFQASSVKLIEELRHESTKAANEIEAAAEEGKQRFAALLAKGTPNG